MLQVFISIDHLEKTKNQGKILIGGYYRLSYYWSPACAYWHIWKHRRWHSEIAGELKVGISW